MSPDELLTIDEAADALGCTSCNLRIWRDKGIVQFEQRKGGRDFVRAGALVGLPMRRTFRESDLASLRRKRVSGFASRAEAEKWCTADEAAAITGATVKTVRRWHLMGKCRARRIGQNLYFLKEELATMRVDPAAREVGLRLQEKQRQKRAAESQQEAGADQTKSEPPAE